MHKTVRAAQTSTKKKRFRIQKSALLNVDVHEILFIALRRIFQLCLSRAFVYFSQAE